MSDKFVFLSQFYANFQKNDIEYWSIIPLSLIEGTTYQLASNKTRKRLGPSFSKLT